METTITGIWTALITPFTADGEVDIPALDALLAEQMQAGIAGLVLIGSTGEGLTLSVQEKLTVLRRAVSRVQGKLKIMSGTGTIGTEQTLEFAKLAVDTGANSLLITTPPYVKASTAGLLAHYRAIAQETDVPICLYHIPARTGQRLTLAQFKQLTAIPQVVAVKEAGSDMAFYTDVVLTTGVSVLSGDDLSFLPSLAAGGQGCISVIANIFPQQMQMLYRAYQRGDNDKAQAMHQRLFPLMQALFWEANPAPVKAILAERGSIKNHLRLPLTAVKNDTYLRLQEVLRATETPL